MSSTLRRHSSSDIFPVLQIDYQMNPGFDVSLKRQMKDTKTEIKRKN